MPPFVHNVYMAPDRWEWHLPSMSTAQTKNTGFVGFDAEQAEDGTWTIHNVPVFSVHVDERGKEPEVFDEAWLNTAVSRGKAREAEQGYLGPLHTHHHGSSDEIEFAGNYRLRGVAPFRYEGEDLPTIFVDFVNVPDAVYQRIKRGELPYRSVEIPPKGAPEAGDILSIALLDHEVPYFRYGNMRIVRERLQRKGKRYRTSALVTRCYSLEGSNPELLVFDYGAQQEERNMADESKKPKEELRQFNLADTLKEIMAMLGKVLESMDTGEEEPEEAPLAPAMQAETGPVEVRAAKPKPEEDPKHISTESQFAPAPGPLEFASKREQGLAGELAALKRQVALMHSQGVSELDQALADFRAAGASPQDVQQFTALARESGPEAAKAYARTVQTFLASVPPAPPAFGAAGAELPAPRVEPEEIRAYAEIGPEAVDLARHHARTWEKSSKRHSLKDWLGAHMNPAGFLDASKNGQAVSAS